MPLYRDDAERLRSATERWLRRPDPGGEGDAGATVELHSVDGAFQLTMRAGGRSMDAGVDDGLYHIEPDGSDVETHAEWLAQAFNEDAQDDDPPPRRPLPEAAPMRPDVVVTSQPEDDSTYG